MYTKDMKIFAKNKKEWETLLQTFKIHCQDIWREFGTEKYIILIMK